MRTLLIDNYDSYTYIIAQYLWKINDEYPLVIKNDALSVEALRGLPFDNIVISPGPGTPGNAGDVGLSMQVFGAFPDVPILGICLGHQCLGHCFGGQVVPAPREMHGKYAEISLRPSSLFADMPPVVKVVRYHSLIVADAGLPDCLEPIAYTIDSGLIMALQHKEKPYFGVQFHPESVGTEYGEQIIRNFKRISERWGRTRRVSEPAARRSFVVRPLPWADPERVFASCFKGEPYAFWLDSSLTGANGRFSFMGNPEWVEESMENASFFDTLEAHLAGVAVEESTSVLPFRGGLVGYVGYEAGRQPGMALTDYRADYPESLFMWVERFVAYDHQAHRMYLCSVLLDEAVREAWFARMEAALQTLACIPKLKFVTGASPCHAPPLPLASRRSKAGYLEDIGRIKEHLKSGNTYETCLTNEYKVQAEVDSFALYQVLRLTNPAPYAAYLQLPEVSILSSSPECFINIDSAGHIKSEPIKGTRAKGTTIKETDLIRTSLSASAKDHSELLMIVDLVRNDLSMCCQKGTVEVTDFMKITEYATVLQLSATISGQLRPGIGAVDVLRKIFPGGSVTGAPKYRTMQLIDQLEQRRRGAYTGSIGYLSLDGAADFNIAIRTLVHYRQTHEITFGSGGAIVAESEPEGEYHETLVKAYALLRAIYLAKYGQFDEYRVEHEFASPAQKSVPEAGSLQQYFAGHPDLDRIFSTNQHPAGAEAASQGLEV